MRHVLVIAYGNPLRCDDGIAWQAAEELERELGESAEIICAHQLTPELAENVSRTDMVIFLDASNNGEPGSVHCDAVFARSDELHFAHHLAPAEILALSDRLYSARPQAFLISIHGECFDHGQELSPSVIHAVPQVVVEVCNLMKHLQLESGTLEPLTTTAVQFP